MSANAPKDGKPASAGTYALVAALSAIIGFAAVYATGSPPDNGVPQAAAEAKGSELPEAGTAGTGQLTGFVRRNPPVAVADIKFLDGEGRETSLSAFRGKVILLNLWATWCAPCRREMPALDRLQKTLGSESFEVVALAVDRTGLEQAKKFLAEAKVESLKTYADPTARAGSALHAVGLPTTILIDKEGRERGRLPGPAEWDSAAAKALIEAALK